MDLHDDDDAEFFDVPDLDSRTWRHPSEVAAGLAATAPPPPDEELDISNRRQPHLVGAVVAAAMCTMGLVFGGVLQPGTMLEAKQVQIDPALGFAPDGTYIATDATSPAFNRVTTGLFTSPGPPGRFIARHVVVDGMILTSASALEGRKSVVFRLDQIGSAANSGSEIVEMPVKVLRLSPEHDLAILALPEQATTPLGGWSPETNTAPPDDLDEVVSMNDCAENPVDGQIRFVDVATTSTTGVALDGLVQTSMPALDCTAGSPITNADGELVGMAASTQGPQTFFVPARQISEELALATA